jgi:polyphosphate glucokinase
MELAHLSYKKGTFEDYVGARGLKRLGEKKWQQHVEYGVERLIAAFHPDDVVLGGGNAKKLKKLPPGCRMGTNTNAFLGGFLLWKDAQSRPSSVRTKAPRSRRSAEKPKEYEHGVNRIAHPTPGLEGPRDALSADARPASA